MQYGVRMRSFFFERSMALLLSLVLLMTSSTSASELFRVEGKVVPPSELQGDDLDRFYWQTRLTLDDNFRVGFLKNDNSFVIEAVPSGSYVLHVSNPDHVYESVRIDVNSKGKMRARKPNHVQPTQVNQVSYPLKLKSVGRRRYFGKREEWKLTDVLMNPMVLMMFLPLILITVLPKMINDPETKREMEQMQDSLNVQNQLPEVSQVMANWFGGNNNNKGNAKKRNSNSLNTVGSRR